QVYLDFSSEVGCKITDYDVNTLLLVMHCKFATFFYQCYLAHLDLHSFPTRRSSDLLVGCRQRLATEAQISLVAALHTLSDVFSLDRKSTRLNSSHDQISYAVFCLKKKNFVTSIFWRSCHYVVVNALTMLCYVTVRIN